MISHRLQSVPINGYYEYLSKIRQRVNVESHGGSDNEEIMVQANASMMDGDTTAAAATSSVSTDDSQKQSIDLSSKDVTEWSSAEVQHWVEEQCQKFELKKATTEQFQLNGQALVLLTKHDFLRRTPDGGEILYYALRRLINPPKTDSVGAGQNSWRNSSARQNNRIVEVGSDSDEHQSTTDSSCSAKPIVEEPDDPPLHRSSDSKANSEPQQNQYYSQAFIHNHAHIRQPVFTMHNPAYYQQQQAFPNTFVYTHQHPHVHAHIPQQQFFHAQPHAQFIHQYHPMMAAHGILLEVIDNEEANNLTGNVVTSALGKAATNGTHSNAQEQLYQVTINGQRYVMNEEQLRHYIAQIQQQQQQQQYTYQPSQDNTFHTT